VYLVFLIILNILGFVGANLCFKKAALFSSASTQAWIWFALGNLIGFLGPVSITLALKQGSASGIFAISVGLGFLVLQLSLWAFHQEPMSAIQWFGASFIVIGLVLINWGRIG